MKYFTMFLATQLLFATSCLAGNAGTCGKPDPNLQGKVSSYMQAVHSLGTSTRAIWDLKLSRELQNFNNKFQCVDMAAFQKIRDQAAMLELGLNGASDQANFPTTVSNAAASFKNDLVPRIKALSNSTSKVCTAKVKKALGLFGALGYSGSKEYQDLMNDKKALGDNIDRISATLNRIKSDMDRNSALAQCTGRGSNTQLAALSEESQNQIGSNARD